MRASATRRELGDRLRCAREMAGISARRLDELAGLNFGHTASIESGRRPNIEVRTAEKLTRALGISLDWLIRGDSAGPTAAQVRAAVSAPSRLAGS